MIKTLKVHLIGSLITLEYANEVLSFTSFNKVYTARIWILFYR